MSYITKYGTQWGTVPPTTGDVYFVAPSASYTVGAGRASGQVSYIASDNNDGHSPERALLTIQRAVDLCTASAGDVVVLLPGSHTLTATLDLDKAGVAILGLHSGAAEGRTKAHYATKIVGGTGGNTGLNDDLINITASHVEIGYVELVPTQGYDAICFETVSALQGLDLHDITIDLETQTASTSTRGINFGHRGVRAGSGYEGLGSGAAATIYASLTNIWTRADGAQGPAIEMASVSALMRGCIFELTGNHNTWAIPLRVATDVVNSLLEDSRFIASGTMTQAISLTDATAVGDINGRIFLRNVSFQGKLANPSKPVEGGTLGGTSSLFGQAVYGNDVVVYTATGPTSVTLIT